MLEGYDALREKGKKADLLSKRPDSSGDSLPFLAKIKEVRTGKDDAGLTVSWDQGEGMIGYEGLKPVAEAWLRGRIGPKAALGREHLLLFLNRLKVDQFVPVTLKREQETQSGYSKHAVLLSGVPLLEGGIIVLKEGMVKTMVGGFFNRFFNRTIDAKRQLGSIFKPVVYAAALQLKWNILDPLTNSRDLFCFENTFYLPNPDHEPENDTVSMAWAGARSENLATVWLLYHLTDRLNMGEFRRVVDLVGLGQNEGETYKAYKERIRDGYGIIVNNRTMREAAFEKAKEQARSDLIFGGYEELLGSLGRIHFDLPNNVLDDKNQDHAQIQRWDFQRLAALNNEMKNKAEVTRKKLRQPVLPEDAREFAELSESLVNFYVKTGKGMETKIIYTDFPTHSDSDVFSPITPDLAVSEVQMLSDPGAVWIDGLIPSEMIDLLEDNTEMNYGEMPARKRYSFETLSGIRDFRTLVNLSFVVYLSKKLGITTELDPVLSFPLGPNSISIMETALAYETMLTGNSFPLADGEKEGSIPIIQRISDREGNIIYEYESRPKKVISDRVAVQVSEILRNVMKNGTGSRAGDAVKVFDVPIPSFGKTGTANNYTNSSFVGFIPGYDGKRGQISMKDGYVIASYVGYDDNRPMKGKYLSVYGAAGVLPLWVDTAKSIAGSPDYLSGLQPADLIFAEIVLPERIRNEFRKEPVSPMTGLPLPPFEREQGRSQGPGVLSNMQNIGGELKLMRHFEPDSAASP